MLSTEIGKDRPQVDFLMRCREYLQKELELMEKNIKIQAAGELSRLPKELGRQ